MEDLRFLRVFKIEIQWRKKIIFPRNGNKIVIIIIFILFIIIIIIYLLFNFIYYHYYIIMIIKESLETPSLTYLEVSLTNFLGISQYNQVDNQD
jgi:hypothetical protein